MTWWLLYGVGAAYWLAAWGQEWADAPRGSVTARRAAWRMLGAPVWPFLALLIATHTDGTEG